MFQRFLSTMSWDNACSKNYSVGPRADGRSKKKTKQKACVDWVPSRGQAALPGALQGWTHLALATGPQGSPRSHPCSIHATSRAQYLAQHQPDGAGSSGCALWVAQPLHPSPLSLASVRGWCSPPGEVLGLPVPLELLMPLLGICAEEEIQGERKLCVSGKAIPCSHVCSKKKIRPECLLEEKVHGYWKEWLIGPCSMKKTLMA